jgi:hypothetical protein
MKANLIAVVLVFPILPSLVLAATGIQAGKLGSVIAGLRKCRRMGVYFGLVGGGATNQDVLAGWNICGHQENPSTW